MLKKLLVILALGLWGLWGEQSWAQTASALIAPNAMTQFLDANGAPYSGGLVYFYVPGTTTPSPTWQDPYETTLNANPVVLDSAGRAAIWGAGTYRQVLKDQYSSTVWDRLTSATLNPAGTGTGVYVLQNSPTINSPLLTGTPSAPTAAAGTSTTQIATTAFVTNAFNKSFVLATSNPYNAKCDGVTDDTAAFNAALAIAQWVLVPAGKCVIAGTLNMVVGNQRLSGSGMGTSQLFFTGSGGTGINIGSAPSIINCTGSTPPVNCTGTLNTTVDNLTLYGGNRTGGYMFNVNGASVVNLQNLYITGWQLITAQYANDVLFSNDNVYMYGTGGSAIYLTNPIATGTYYTSNRITFQNFFMNVQGLGLTCATIDGPVYSVRFNSVELSGCGYGVATANTVHNATLFPRNFYANDLEISACNAGLSIGAGANYEIVNSSFDTIGCSNVTGNYPLIVSPDSSYSLTKEISIANSSFFGAGGQDAVLGGRNIQISNSSFYNSNLAGTGAAPTIEILNSSRSVIISNSFVGQRTGDADAPSYGVTVDAGTLSATIVLDVLSANGALTGSVNNGSAAPIGWLYGVTSAGALNAATTCAATTAC